MSNNGAGTPGPSARRTELRYFLLGEEVPQAAFLEALAARGGRATVEVFEVPSGRGAYRLTAAGEAAVEQAQGGQAQEGRR
jgi:hypothetical protein